MHRADHLTRRIRRSLDVLLLAGAAACSACGAAGPPTATVTLIDDMEGTPAGAIPWIPPPSKAPGNWFVQTDCTENDRISPRPWTVPGGGWSYEELLAPHETWPGVMSVHAARLRTTTPLTSVWGAVMGVDLLPEIPKVGPDGQPLAAVQPVTGPGCRQPTTRDYDGETVDLSAYTGITFWAMADPNGLHTIRVHVRDQSTDPRGGVCTGRAPDSDADCYNDFTFPLVLTEAFTRYTVDFSTMHQDPSWGEPSWREPPETKAVDLRHVYAIAFQADLPSCAFSQVEICAGSEPPSFALDFRIDDLYLVNRTP